MHMRLLLYIPSAYFQERSAVAISTDGRMSVVRGLDLWQKKNRYFSRDLKPNHHFRQQRNKISQTVNDVHSCSERL